MKTIKEHKHCTETCKLCNSMRNAGKEQMKEDVLKLIDELMLKYGSMALEELKAKIEG